MIADGHRESARIFAFPTDAVRRRTSAQRGAELGPTKGRQATLKTYGGAWYHDSAIRDSEAEPKK